jgi:type IV pilus assembly protein PilE
MDRHKGFTLIEILIAVAAIAIIVAVAMPSYSNYVRRAKLQEAATNLLTLNLKQKLFWNDHESYGQADCGVGALPAPTQHFSYVCNINNSQQGYIITAKGQGDLLNYNFTIDQAGNRVTTDFPGASGLPYACWLFAPGSCL